MNRTYFMLMLLTVTTAHAAPSPKPLTGITLPSGSPQLANLRLQPVEAVPEPALPALNGRIAFDENRSARISSPVAGRVLAIKAQVGDAVKKGQPLLLLDAPELGGATADRAKAEADLALKRKALDRAKLLFDGGVIARKDLDGAENDFAQSSAEAQRARLRLANFGGAGSGEVLVLRAPIAGVVVDRQVNPGTEVRPDAPNPLFILTDPHHVTAIIDLPERDLGVVRVGQRAVVEVDAYPDAAFAARVTAIGGVLDPATRRVQVRCEVAGKGQLKPEMYARVTLVADRGRQVIRVPNTALLTKGLYQFVLVETAPGHIERRAVRLASQDRDFSIVDTGLQSGERIVTAGALLLDAEIDSGH